MGRAKRNPSEAPDKRWVSLQQVAETKRMNATLERIAGIMEKRQG